MTKQDHIAYWMNAAEQNWQEVGSMFTAGTYVPCLFWAHLTIEKLAKALWVQDNPSDTPPFTHNIARLLADTSLVLTPGQATFVQQLNTFQLEGRYESYTANLRQQATRVFTQTVLQDVTDLRQCLLNQLP
ncbi:HEPN domain-containing protein [Hymenobacter sp. ASUV-10]|uniref:HEPN domain-containing protein n=1 Tax=Hymenobacter aranciens TaxID=3063996 RepID=A0ABT9BD39_9BACT|nr:HEPN domain-containing protein [Hymenobacter sp. ASUV-10]MDO7875588.1 HEPN domain-containing protein [Hymenobacter sp. ASUV-10]